MIDGKKMDKVADSILSSMSMAAGPIEAKENLNNEDIADRIAKELLSTDNEKAYKDMLQELSRGTPVLTGGEIHEDIPTIQTFAKKFWSSVKHIGMGLFIGQTPSGEFSFDGGGAMNRAGDFSWTRLQASKEVLRDLKYDANKAKRALKELLQEKDASEITEFVAREAAEDDPDKRKNDYVETLQTASKSLSQMATKLKKGTVSGLNKRSIESWLGKLQSAVGGVSNILGV